MGVMSDLKELIKKIILNHRGRYQAIKGEAIARMLGLSDDRQVREIIKVLEKELPIASATEKPYGYYIAEDYIEAKDYEQSLKNRAIAILCRRRDFKRAAGERLDMVKQGSLF